MVVQAYNFGKFDFELWVDQKGHVPVVLGPCVQCCSCEASASEQNGANN